MKKLLLLTAVITASVLVTPQVTFAQASHAVNVTVNAINVLAVGGNVNLTIDSATAGLAPDSDTGTSTYSFTTNSATNKKLTAATDIAMPAGLALSVDLTAPAGGGSSAGDTALSTTAADVITDLAQLRDAGVSMTYTAAATVAAAVTTTNFTVTYTMTDQ